MDDYYIIQNKTIKGITKNFKKLIQKNGFNAPKIPEGIEKIDEDTFKELDELNEIYIPSSIKELSIKVFERFENIKINYNDLYFITIRKKDLYGEYNKVYKLSGYHPNLNEYLKKNKGLLPEIPKWVSCLGEFSFKENPNIKKIIFNNEIAIFKESFYNCQNLSEIIGSENIRDYGDDVFNKCINLKNINIPINIVNIRSNVFKDCKKLKINMLNIDTINAKEFTIKGRNLYLKNRKSVFKTIKTKNSHYFIDNDKVTKILKKDFIYRSTINKHLGYKYSNKTNFEDNLETSYRLYKELNYVPYDFITKNIKPSYVDNYLQYLNEFEKVILSKARLIATKKTLNNNNELIGRLTSSQYESLLKISIISGFFEKSEMVRKKSINLINNYLLPIDSKKGLNLTLTKFDSIIKRIDSQNVSYNREFAEYFLFNKDNLIKLINKLKKSNKTFINTLVLKCGDSDIKYKHNDIYENSNGLLHDEWLIYRNNNNDKHVNNDNNNKSTVLSFIDWALTIDEQNDYNDLNIDNTILELFTPYYNNVKALIKLDEIISNSKKTTPYIFIPKEYTTITNKEFNIAHIYSSEVIKRIQVSEIKDEQHIKELIELEKNKLTVEEDNYKAEVLDKSNIMIAYLNCVMGACSVVTSTGCEYLYEAYYDDSTQPFIIYKGNKPIASFRIDIDKNKGIGSINSLEVLSAVKFKYSIQEKEKIVKVFNKIINNFINLYNKYNKIPIKRISMGKLSNFDINDVLESHYKTTPESFFIKERLVCTPSTKNHFIIYEKRG